MNASPPIAAVMPGQFGWVRCRGEAAVRGVAVIRIDGSMSEIEHQDRRYWLHVSRVKARHNEAAESPEPTPEQDPFS